MISPTFTILYFVVVIDDSVIIMYFAPRCNRPKTAGGCKCLTALGFLRALRLILNEGDFDAAVDFFVAEVFGDGFFAYIGDCEVLRAG